MTQFTPYSLTKDQAVQADVEAGTANKFANTAAIRAAMPYTKQFTSTEQTITNGSNTTVAHGIGAQPYECSAVLRCKTAELGYAVGDETVVGGQNNGSGYVALTSNTTNTIISVTGQITVYNRSVGGFTAITNANWRIVAKVKG